MASAPYTVDVTVRFRDLDPMGHVNNAVYATYLEHARACYYRDVLGLGLSEVDTVLAHLEIDYDAPIQLDDSVTVAVTVPRLGTSSIPMDYEVTVDDDVVATASSVQVVWDRASGQSTPIPDGWRSAIESFEGR